MDSRSIDVDGLRFRWLECGQGEPVICLHGIPTSPRLWRFVLPSLDARAIAWELVGYGGSIAERQDRELSVAQQAAWLVQWMDAVGIGSAVLVGHDIGGGIAQVLAVRHPERVRGLVLTNSVAYDSWPITEVRILRALGGLVSRLPDGVVRFLLGLLFRQGHDDPGRAQEAFAEHWRYYAEADGGAALVRQMRALHTSDTLAIAEGLRSLRLPAEVVWGAADPYHPLSYGEHLAADLRAPLDRIHSGRHFVPEDHPRRIAASVHRVLERIADARSAGAARLDGGPPA